MTSNNKLQIIAANYRTTGFQTKMDKHFNTACLAWFNGKYIKTIKELCLPNNFMGHLNSLNYLNNSIPLSYLENLKSASFIVPLSIRLL